METPHPDFINTTFPSWLLTRFGTLRMCPLALLSRYTLRPVLGLERFSAHVFCETSGWYLVLKDLKTGRVGRSVAANLHALVYYETLELCNVQVTLVYVADRIHSVILSIPTGRQ